MKIVTFVGAFVAILLTISGVLMVPCETRLADEVQTLSSAYMTDRFTGSQNLIRVIVLGRGNANAAKNLMRSGFSSYFPSGFAVVGQVSRSNLQALSSLENVVRIMPDFPICYDEKSRLEVDSPGPQTDMFRIRELTGASRTNIDLGLNGSGVTVAIVDTGVDFGNPDISNAVARDAEGKPIAIDADEQGLVITNTTFQAKMESLENQNIMRSSSDIQITSKGIFLDIWNQGLGTDIKYWNGTEILTAHLAENFKIGEDTKNFILSKSGVYHFGLLMEKDSFGGPGANEIFYPVLVVDSRTAGLYDSVYVDFSSTYARWAGSMEADYSFFDETSHHVGDGSEILASDLTGDGMPDISAGLLGAQILDVWGVFQNQTSEYDTILGFPSGVLLPGLDPKGDFIGVMFDFEPHGTFCAANVASRGVVEYDVYGNGTTYKLPGIAPDSSIIAAKALWLGDVFYTWMWVSGFDLDAKSGRWVYTGRHRAEVVSNSWGWSEWPLLGAGVGYDLLSIIENALSLPGFLSHGYPGALFVHAVGNGGPGYGTMTSSGFSSFALSVGASTSFHWASSLGLERMGVYSNAGDDVVAWSCRGPNALGQSKPDLLNVGAFSFDAGPINGGYGNGSRAYDVFGGTSQAAPLTAGAAAIVVEGLKRSRREFDPSTVKTILMSTAQDLGNDPFVQGSGRVDVYKAASYTIGRDTQDCVAFRIHTNTTYTNVMESLADAWAMLDFALPNATMIQQQSNIVFEDTSWYAGTIPNGDSGSATFVVDNPSNTPINLSVKSSVLELAATYSYSNRSDPSLNGVPLYFDLTKIAGPMPNDTVLMIVRLDYSFESFYNSTATPYGSPSNLLYLYAYDWEDINQDASVQWNETALVNYGYNWGNSQEIRIFHPFEKMMHEKVIGVWEATPKYMKSSGDVTAEETYSYEPVNFTIHVDCYKKTSWTWLSSRDQISVDSKSSTEFTATVQIPEEVSPGVYGGYLVLECPGRQTTYVPVSAKVPIELSKFNEPEEINRVSTHSSILYDNSFMHGATDWKWRYESGDWRIIPLKINVADSSSEEVLVFRLEWTNPNTSIDIYVLDPSGNITGTTTPPIGWLFDFPNNWVPGTGVFYPSQNAGANATIVTVPVNEPGLYTIVLHTTLFDGRQKTEKFDAILDVAQLRVRPPEIQVLDYLPYLIGFASGIVLTLVILTSKRGRRAEAIGNNQN